MWGEKSLVQARLDAAFGPKRLSVQSATVTQGKLRQLTVHLRHDRIAGSDFCVLDGRIGFVDCLFLFEPFPFPTQSLLKHPPG